MKLITAMVRPPVFKAIKETLALFGVRGMTADHVLSVGNNTGHIQIYRGQRFTTDAQPTVKVELLVPDDEVSDLSHVISKIVAGDGSDGSVWISPIDLVVRVRTNEYGLDAL